MNTTDRELEEGEHSYVNASKVGQTINQGHAPNSHAPESDMPQLVFLPLFSFADQPGIQTAGTKHDGSC